LQIKNKKGKCRAISNSKANKLSNILWCCNSKKSILGS